MPHQIGDSVVSAIEEVELSSSKDKDEKQLYPDEETLLLDSQDNGEDITIQAVIIDGDVGPVENRIDDLEGLTENEASINYISYEDFRGRISVDNVSEVNSSSLDNLRRVEVSGKFLPYPQYFPDEVPEVFLFSPSVETQAVFEAKLSDASGFQSDIFSDLQADGSIALIVSLSSDTQYNLSSLGDVSLNHLLNSQLDHSLNISSSITYFISESGNLFQEFITNGDILIDKIINGQLNTKVNTSASVGLEKSISTVSNYQLNSSGKTSLVLSLETISNHSLNLNSSLSVGSLFGNVSHIFSSNGELIIGIPVDGDLSSKFTSTSSIKTEIINSGQLLLSFSCSADFTTIKLLVSNSASKLSISADLTTSSGYGSNYGDDYGNTIGYSSGYGSTYGG